MSLGILLPTNQQTPPQLPLTTNHEIAVAQHLETLTANLLVHLNARDFNNPELSNLFAPEFVATHDRTNPHTSATPSSSSSAASSEHLGREAYVRFAQAVIQRAPAFHLRLVAVSTSVDKSLTFGKVWATLRAGGLLQGGGEIETVSRHEWRRIVGGRWVLLGYQSLASMGLVDGLEGA